MDSPVGSLLFIVSIISCCYIGGATYTASQDVDCDLIANAACSVDVKYQDVSYGVTEDIEYLTTFRFQGQQCVNPRITLDYVQQDFASANEYLKVFDGETTSSSELAQCGTQDGWRSGDCSYHNCLEDKALSTTDVDDQVKVLIFVAKDVDGLHHSESGGDACPGGYNLDAKLTVTCDPCNAFETCSRLGAVEDRLDAAGPVVASNSNRLDALEAAVQSLETTMRKMSDSLASYSGTTAAPLGTSDYVLFALGMANVVAMAILLVYCLSARASTAASYGKVQAYDTETA